MLDPTPHSCIQSAAIMQPTVPPHMRELSSTNLPINRGSHINLIFLASGVCRLFLSVAE